MKRHIARQRAVQALYQIDVGKAELTPSVRYVLEEDLDFDADDVAFIEGLVFGTRRELSDIDTLIETYVEGWQMSRIAKVELEILRVSAYELLYSNDVDAATILDEAVELAKDFSTDTAGKFVNGVLSKMLPAVQEARQSRQ